MKNKLILLHGALGSKDQFGEFIEMLTAHFDVFAFNFSGHGGNLIQAAFSIESFVKDTVDFMDRNQIESAHLFGYSMGGYVALKLAYDFPNRVNAILTLGTKFQWDPESAAKEVRMMDPEIIEQKIPKFAEILKKRHVPEDWKKIMTNTGEMMTRLGAGKAMMLTDFEKINHRVCIGLGTDDHMVTQKESSEVAGHLHNGKLKLIDGFKHPFESVDLRNLSMICVEFFNLPN